MLAANCFMTPGLAAFLHLAPLAADGCSVNIADRGAAVNVEVDRARRAVARLGSSTMLHCNMYTHLPRVDEVGRLSGRREFFNFHINDILEKAPTRREFIINGPV